MKYKLDGKDLTREELQAHLDAELALAEKSVHFRGRIFYNLDYIEHVANDFMRRNGDTSFAYMDMLLIAD